MQNGILSDILSFRQQSDFYNKIGTNSQFAALQRFRQLAEGLRTYSRGAGTGRV
jgi:hypothetical protein